MPMRCSLLGGVTPSLFRLRRGDPIRPFACTKKGGGGLLGSAARLCCRAEGRLGGGGGGGGGRKGGRGRTRRPIAGQGAPAPQERQSRPPRRKNAERERERQTRIRPPSARAGLAWLAGWPAGRPARPLGAQRMGLRRIISIIIIIIKIKELTSGLFSSPSPSHRSGFDSRSHERCRARDLWTLIRVRGINPYYARQTQVHGRFHFHPSLQWGGGLFQSGSHTPCRVRG